MKKANADSFKVHIRACQLPSPVPKDISVIAAIATARPPARPASAARPSGAGISPVQMNLTAVRALMEVIPIRISTKPGGKRAAVINRAKRGQAKRGDGVTKEGMGSGLDLKRGWGQV
jgi:hypothetical protein